MVSATTFSFAKKEAAYRKPIRGTGILEWEFPHFPVDGFGVMYVAYRSGFPQWIV